MLSAFSTTWDNTSTHLTIQLTKLHLSLSLFPQGLYIHLPIVAGYVQLWPKLDLQNLSLVGFVLFTAIRALSSQAVAAVVRLPNLPSPGCPYKAYKVTTTSLYSSIYPPGFHSCYCASQQFSSQRATLPNVPEGCVVGADIAIDWVH